jgi:copper chaperone CopZ
MTKKLLTVPDISCEHCDRAIKGALAPLEGVRSVEVDIPGHQIWIEFEETLIGLDRIEEILLEEEYPVAAVC